MSEEEQALQHLIERCDVKIATHIGVMIGIIFGSFTILGFLRGAGFPPKNLYVVFNNDRDIGCFSNLPFCV